MTYRCTFHMAQCPGGCAQRGWCWQEGDPRNGTRFNLVCTTCHAGWISKAASEQCKRCGRTCTMPVTVRQLVGGTSR